METTKTIQEIYQVNGYILDPHTAVAAVEAIKKSDSSNHFVVLSTAHPCKFPAATDNAINKHEELIVGAAQFILIYNIIVFKNISDSSSVGKRLSAHFAYAEAS